jgi:hypothetical protein
VCYNGLISLIDSILWASWLFEMKLVSESFPFRLARFLL